MSIYEKAEQYRQNPSIETFKAYFDAFQALPELTIYRTGLKIDFVVLYILVRINLSMSM